MWEIGSCEAFVKGASGKDSAGSNPAEKWATHRSISMPGFIDFIRIVKMV